MVLDNFDLIKNHQHEDYLIMYKRYRELYMAERNFMLTFSALFVTFAYYRFVEGIKKLVDVENVIDEKVAINKSK